MALLESRKLKLGVIMPDFDLQTPFGELVNANSSIGNKGLLIVFTCNHCPYAQAVWPRLIRLAGEIWEYGVNTIAINSNINPDYPEDSPEKMIEEIEAREIFFPYLVDENQSIARLYQAECTPDIYLLDSEGRLVYHGRFDDNWKDEARVHSRDLEKAVLALTKGKKISPVQNPSIGCSIKWVSR